MSFAHSRHSSMHSAHTEHRLYTWPSARRGDYSVVWVDTGAPCLQGQSPAGPPGLRELMTSSLGPGPEWGTCAHQRPRGPEGLRARLPAIRVKCWGWGAENGAPFLLASPRAPGRTTPPSQSALDWSPEAWGLGSEPRPHLIRRG